MPSLVVYTSNADGYLDSSGITYSAVDSGTGSGGVAFNDSGTTMRVGQWLDTLTFHIYEGFLRFNTASIPDSATIDSASLELKAAASNPGPGFTVNARRLDWVAPLGSEEWQTATGLSSLTLMANRGSAGFPVGSYAALTSQSGMTGNISVQGETRFVLSSTRHEGLLEPTGAEHIDFYSGDAGGTATTDDPKLTVNYTEAAAPASSKRTRLGLSLKLGW